MKVRSLAAMRGVCTQTVIAAIKRGDLKGQKIGGQWIIFTEDAAGWKPKRRHKKRSPRTK